MPLSAHPSSCFKGFITGEILRYWNQNSREEDFVQITSQFMQQLLQQGQLLSSIVPIIWSAASKIDHRHSDCFIPNNKLDNEDTLFLSWEYHPRDISKSEIHRIYQNTLQDNVNFTKMKIAMSRPNNLRDLLCQTQLLNDGNKYQIFLPKHDQKSCTTYISGHYSIDQYLMFEDLNLTLT